MRIFIAGSYTADHPRKVLNNVNKAIDAGIQLMEMGHSVFIPHLSHYIHLRPHCTFEYEEYMRNDTAFLEVCDAIYRLPGKSAGADRECQMAARLNIPVYRRLEDIPE